MAKILYVDIETTPNIGLFWRPGYRVKIDHDNIVEERRICCISYKWADDEDVISLKWSMRQCDKKMLKKIRKVLLEADSIVAHNGDRFDIPWINGRLMYHRLQPMGELPTDDSLKQARKHFSLNSNRLDYIGKFLKIGGKRETGGYGLWKRVLLKNDRQALKDMVEYCEGDVLLMQEIHEEMKPYIKPKQHMGIMEGGTRESCPSCGSEQLAKAGTRITRVGKRQRYQCKDCGHYHTDTRQIKITNKL